MIDEYSDDRRGWARFSDDLLHRYRLGRSFTPFSFETELLQGAPRVVFVLLNPSTADAFDPDPTVTRCCKFAKRWGFDVLEVVNVFSLRSSKPLALADAGSCENAGGSFVNNEEIIQACIGAERVIAAWGLHGHLYGRAYNVRELLVAHDVKLEILGMTQDGTPKHPLARGRHRIPDDTEPAIYV